MSNYTDDIKKRLEAATPGPWVYANHWDHCKAVVETAEKRIICDVYEHEDVYSRNFNHHEANGRLIANAPTDIKNLLEEREVLREALKRLSKAADLKTHHLAAEEALAWVPFTCKLCRDEEDS